MMNANSTDLSGVFAMLEEIKTDLKSYAQNAVDKVDIEAAKTLTATMRDVIDEVRQPVTVEKRLTLNFSGSHTAIFTVAAVVVVVAAFIIISIQQKALSKLSDNDLKYRYIEMRGAATPEDILMLREVFDFNRHADSIKTIRKRVEKYERLIREQAEKAARASLTAEKAEELKQKAEKVKNGNRQIKSRD